MVRRVLRNLYGYLLGRKQQDRSKFAATVITQTIVNRSHLCHKLLFSPEYFQPCSMNRLEPKIFGILNITEDSFSDGGAYLANDRATEHAASLLADGADVIDIGPAASNPDANQVSPQEEINRLEPIIKVFSGRIQLSVDSFKSETQLWAMEHGIDYINDIHGFSVPEIYPKISHSNCRLIVMHSIQSTWKADKAYTEPDTLFARVTGFFEKRVSELTDAGISRNRIIIDPGMGYFLGSNPEASISMLKRISDLKEQMELPVMVSVSRKSFLRNITGRSAQEALPATLAAEVFAALSGVDYIRTHDVRALRDVLKVLQVLGA